MLIKKIHVYLTKYQRSKTISQKLCMFGNARGNGTKIKILDKYFSYDKKK